MLFNRLLLTRFFSMLTFLTLAACSARAVEPSPGELMTPNITAAPTDPLATFWLPTPTGETGGTSAAGTPGLNGTPGPIGGDDDPSQPPSATQPASMQQTPGAAPPVGGATVVTTPGAPAGSGLTNNLPPVVASARTWLSNQLRTVETDVVLQNVERVSWPDSCLGLGSAGQNCAQVVTPGYRVIFYANGQTYEVRVDDAGRIFRLLEGGKG